MTQCWSEGELRAYLDRELPPDDMERVAAHLEQCSECGDLWAELAGRASRVSALMGTLPGPDRNVWIPRAPRPARAAGWRWVGAAGLLAAGLLLGIVALPKHPPQVTLVLPAPPVTPAAIPDPVAPQIPAMRTAVARPVAARAVPASRKRAVPTIQPNDFVALDDEPIDTGVVLRVVLGPKEIPADVIFGSDGRPHAIRLVDYKPKH